MIVVQWSDWIRVRRERENRFGRKKEREREKKKTNITQLAN